MTGLEETTIRDFGGGWNASDSDKALVPRYQRLSDNVVRGTSGRLQKRYGYALFGDVRKGVETVVAPAGYTVSTTNGSGEVNIQKNAHGYTSGHHINIDSFSADLNGLPVSAFLGVHGIHVIDANNFRIYVRGSANTTSSAARTIAWTHDTHKMSARDIFARYYKNHLIVFDESGEIVAIDRNGNVTQIWNFTIAKGLTVEPWSACKRVSAEIVRGQLIAVNGAENDKPLAISNLTVNYLVDASTLTNSAIPRADFVIATSNYVILVNTEYGETKLEIGAKNTVMTCSRETDPADAVEIDVGMLTQTVDATILGASVIRSKVFLGFADRSMLGIVGIYNNDVHEPDFNDNIPEFGSFAHSAIISLGNDLLCVGMNGVNSLETSRASGEITPTTVSDLIHPVLLRHLWRLTEEDRRYRVFAVWDTTTRSYMLFVPKYSDLSFALGENPIYATTTLQQSSLVYINFPEHKVDEGDYIDISGVTNYSTELLGSMINGRRRVRHVVDNDTLVVEVDPYPAGLNVSFGGNAVQIQPVNDETIAYVYEYNPRLKIRRWTRFRALNFDWGARSQFNRLFFGKNGKIFVMGDGNTPISADEVDNYDYHTYANSFSYVAGDRVKDGDIVWEATVDHTSPGAGTFADARGNFPTYWQEFRGYPISWEVELSWGDFDARSENKQIELVRFDTKGTAAFTFDIFTNSIYKNFSTYLREPVRSTDFVAENSPGFGGGDQPFGGGRNTAQEWLHSMPAFGKLFLLRLSGSSIHPLQIDAVTLYYHTAEGVLT